LFGKIVINGLYMVAIRHLGFLKVEIINSGGVVSDWRELCDRSDYAYIFSRF